GLDEKLPKMGILLTQFVAGVLQAPRSKVAVELDFGRPALFIQHLATQAWRVESDRREVAGSVIDFCTTVGDERIEVRGPHQTGSPGLPLSRARPGVGLRRAVV